MIVATWPAEVHLKLAGHRNPVIDFHALGNVSLIEPDSDHYARVVGDCDLGDRETRARFLDADIPDNANDSGVLTERHIPDRSRHGQIKIAKRVMPDEVFNGADSRLIKRLGSL